MTYVYKYKPETGFDTSELCHIVEMLNDDKDIGCSVAQATVEPGVTTKLHYLKNTIERYVIIKGCGEVEINGEKPILLTPNDVALIPAGVTQRIKNTGKEGLVFLCVCTPRFEKENYVPVE